MEIRFKYIKTQNGINKPFQQEPFICTIENGTMIHNRIYQGSNEIIFNPVIFDDIAVKLYLSKEKHVSPQYIDGHVVTFIKAYNNNYAHWVHDILPCFQFINDFDFIYTTHKKSFQRQSLALLSIPSKKVIDYSKVKAITAKKLTFIYAGNRYDSAITTDYLRTFASPQINKKRIYVSRNDAKVRRVANEKDVLDLLADYKFEVIVPSLLTFQEQIKIFSQSEYVVLPHGAASANLFFCQPRTNVIQFWPKLYRSVDIYPKDLIQHNIVCPPINKHDWMQVNVKELESTLNAKLFL